MTSGIQMHVQTQTQTRTDTGMQACTHANTQKLKVIFYMECMRPSSSPPHKWAFTELLTHLSDLVANQGFPQFFFFGKFYFSHFFVSSLRISCNILCIFILSSNSSQNFSHFLSLPSTPPLLLDFASSYFLF